MFVSFYKLYHEITDIYRTSDNPVTTWTEIATLMDKQQEVITDVFHKLKKTADLSEYQLDYLSDLETIDAKIKSEEDETVKLSLIISAFHVIVYTLSSAKGNYFFPLNGQEEMAVIKKELMYYINISKRNEQNIFFHAFIMVFALESLFNKKLYVGVDFEYTRKKIQLSQLNFEHNVSLISIIHVVSPNELEPIMMENMIKLIMCNQCIKKILHGSDSLDYPYVTKSMLNEDPNKIIKFTNSMIDTRFLCEYYKLNLDVVTDDKCSIYDAARYFGVIDQEKREQLELMESDMPHPNDRVWNIHNLAQSQELYVQYDVLFLKYFYYRIIHMASTMQSTDLGKKTVIDLYKHVMYELTQFIYLENNAITFLTIKCKEETDVSNNYMIKRPHGVFKLKDVFDNVSIGLVTADPHVEIDRLIKVKYFSKVLMLIVKKLTYAILTQKYAVYKSKTELWKEKLDNDYIFDFLGDAMKYSYLKNMFKDIEGTLAVRIKLFCK